MAKLPHLIKKKAIENGAVDGEVIKILEGQAIKAVKDGVDVDLIKISSGVVKVLDAEIETKSGSASKLAEAKTYADGIKSEIMGGLPATALDTIKELADAIAADESSISTLLSSVGSLDERLDIVEGSGAGSIAKALVDAKSYTDTQIAAIPAVDLSNYLKKDGTVAMTGALSMNSHKITGVTSGVDAGDAVNKGQLDSVESALDGRLDIIEGSGSGSIAKALVDAKSYTDTQIAAIPAVDLSNYLKKDGTVAMTGELDMGSKVIKNLAEPTAAAHAATKSYVDGKESALDARIDTLEAKAFGKENLTIAGSVPATFQLAQLAMANSVMIFVGAVPLHEGATDGYTVSTSSGKTLITFNTDALAIGDKVFFYYKY